MHFEQSTYTLSLKIIIIYSTSKHVFKNSSGVCPVSWVMQFASCVILDPNTPFSGFSPYLIFYNIIFNGRELMLLTLQQAVVEMEKFKYHTKIISQQGETLTFSSYIIVNRFLRVRSVVDDIHSSAWLQPVWSFYPRPSLLLSRATCSAMKRTMFCPQIFHQVSRYRLNIT